MASGVHSNFVLYDKFAQTGYNELLVQMTDAFNEASQGAITMQTNVAEGSYSREAYFESIASLSSRRDLTAAPETSITRLALTEDEQVLVKIFRKIGPVTNTRGMFRTIAADPGEFAVRVGQQAAKATMIDQLNTALRAGTTAIGGVAANVHNVTAASPTDTISTDNLIQTLAKFGDAASEIVCWVMHSGAYFKLVREQVSTYSFDSVSGAVIATATPITLNRPVVVTDSPALWNNASPTDPVKVLGLRRGAIRVENSELSDLVVQDVTGGAQLGITVQGEYAFSVGVTGFRWDMANGGANPTDAALTTVGNWDVAFTSAKSLAGVMMIADPV
jgi:Major capsid protein 13-like